MTYKELAAQIKDRLLLLQDEMEAQTQTRLLLAHYLQADRTFLLVHGEEEVAGNLDALYAAVAKREEHIPLQQILGETQFMGLPFKVTKDVLCPRPDTEVLVEEAMQLLHDGMQFLDLCTGSGCIALSLLQYSNDCRGVATDLSENALSIARDNALLHDFAETKPMRFEKEGKHFSLFQGDLFGAVPREMEHSFHMVISNPPYIPTKDIEGLMPEVREHEPMMALDGFADGLFFYREIIKNAPRYLVGEGVLLFEIGYDQGEAVKHLMEEGGFTEVSVKKDFGGNDRVVIGFTQVG